MEPDLTGRDQDVLDQEDQHPAHKDDRMGMDQERRLETGPSGGQLKREPGHDQENHGDRADQEEAFPALISGVSNVRFRHDHPPMPRTGYNRSQCWSKKRMAGCRDSTLSGHSPVQTSRAAMASCRLWDAAEKQTLAIFFTRQGEVSDQRPDAATDLALVSFV
jgi:hypothetical protein